MVPLASCIGVLDEGGWDAIACVAGHQRSASGKTAPLLETYPPGRFALACEPNHRCRALFTWWPDNWCDRFLHWVGQAGIRRKIFCQTSEGSAIWNVVPAFGACPLPSVRWSVHSPLTSSHDAYWGNVLVVLVASQRGLLLPWCGDCWHNGCASGNLRGPLRTV